MRQIGCNSVLTRTKGPDVSCTVCMLMKRTASTCKISRVVVRGAWSRSEKNAETFTAIYHFNC